MIWGLRYERDGFSVKAARAKGRDLPQWFLDRPALPDGCEFFLQAFSDLKTCAAHDAPIPWTAARLYADHHGLEPDVFDLMWAVVRDINLRVCAWNVEQRKQDAEEHAGD